MPRSVAVRSPALLLITLLAAACGDDAHHSANQDPASELDAGEGHDAGARPGADAKLPSLPRGDAGPEADTNSDAGAQAADAGTGADIDAAQPDASSAPAVDAGLSTDAASPSSAPDANAPASAPPDAGRDAGDAGAGNDAGPPLVATVSYTAALTDISTGMAIAVPQEVDILDNDTGAQLVPPIHATSEAETGIVMTKLPLGPHIVWIKGAGDADTGTIDTVIVNFDPDVPDAILNVYPSALVPVVEASGDYVADPQRAALVGAVYWTPDHQRSGTIGCAKVYLDGATGPDDDQGQLYGGADDLPVPLAAQDQTRTSGLFDFANISKGTHTLKVSLDDGATFLGEELTFYVPFSNAEASSQLKRVLVQLAVDIDLPENPTLSTCVDP